MLDVIVTFWTRWALWIAILPFKSQKPHELLKFVTVTYS